MNHPRSARQVRFQPDVPLVLAMALVVLLWMAGGASREDVMGQVVTRAGCWAILAVAVIAGPKPVLTDVRPVVFFVVATTVLPLLQLIPLPPGWWQALPGREMLTVPGDTPDWRPLTMVPGATRNALASLVVPVTVLVVLSQANERLRAWLPTILFAAIGVAVLLGLLQFTGARFNSPLLNDPPGQVTSIFANRNHFALLIAIGCLIAPVWALLKKDALGWRGPVAAGMLLLFLLTILATGSRSGMFLGAISVIFAAIMVWRRLQRRLTKAPIWMVAIIIASATLVIAGLVALSFLSGRAEAIDRLIGLDSSEDLRLTALPTVLEMVAIYMPYGSGFGGFDPLFRIYEPETFLRLDYFNQAHNDWLGIALDGGVPAIVLLAMAVTWWSIATIRVWRARAEEAVLLGRLGSAIILLVLLASITDYPARTPVIMAFVVIAAVWLARANNRPRTALPG